MNCELVFGSFCRKKAEFPFPRWLPNRTMSEQSQGTLSRLYFVPSSCHNSHQGELTNSLAHIFTQQKWDNLPFASLHSGEQTTTAQRERRRSEQPPPTDGVDCLERKFTTAPAEEQTTPFPLLRNMSRQKPGSAAESVSQALPHR